MAAPIKKKPRPAKDLKPGDMRSKFLNTGKPQPAADLKQSNPRDLRNKALREANKIASGRKPRPAKDIKPGDTRSKTLENAKKTTTAKAPNRALVTTGNSRAIAIRPNTAVTIAKETAKTGAKLGLRGLLGAGSAVVGMVTEASPAGSAAERSWERRNTEQRRMKGKVGGMAFNKTVAQPFTYKYTGSTAKKDAGSSYSGYGNKTSSAAYGYTPTTSSSTGSLFSKGKGTAALPVKKSTSPSTSSSTGPKKKAGATSGATPAVSKPKRKSHFQRRQAERYAIGTSGKSL